MWLRWGKQLSLNIQSAGNWKLQQEECPSSLEIKSMLGNEFERELKVTKLIVNMDHSDLVNCFNRREMESRSTKMCKKESQKNQRKWGEYCMPSTCSESFAETD